jgi:Acyclic terpene utilisation family protein AtuA
MSAFSRLADQHPAGRRPLVALAASGQLGYGIPEAALKAGLARNPDFVGCDMGSVDPGPYYLGSGRMATNPEMTRRDLRLVLVGARRLDVPLLLGTAGTAGARPHLEATLAMVREIAREEGLQFRLASIRADVPAEMALGAQARGRLTPLGRIAEPSADDIAKSRIVAQMGVEAFARALEGGADVVIAGRACDTAIFAVVPQMLGYPTALAMHMAKIIECTSICCAPGGRDAILGYLDGDGFVLDSMNPERHATPTSVAAHSLYEQADPFSVAEPEGLLRLEDARYEALDAHRTRVSGARWEPASSLRVKIEGSLLEGQRSVLLAGSADPNVIDRIDAILAAVESTTRSLFPRPFRLFPRIYGRGAVSLSPRGGSLKTPDEIFILIECVADEEETAIGALTIFKQYLLHHGFAGRLSTGGNIAFPLTPPELNAGAAYRFSLYHLMEVDDLAPLFPIEFETL